MAGFHLITSGRIWLIGDTRGRWTKPVADLFPTAPSLRPHVRRDADPEAPTTGDVQGVITLCDVSPARPPQSRNLRSAAAPGATLGDRASAGTPTLGHRWQSPTGANDGVEAGLPVERG